MLQDSSDSNNIDLSEQKIDVANEALAERQLARPKSLVTTLNIIVKDLQKTDTLLNLRDKPKLSTMFIYPAVIYLLKVSNRNTRTRCEICSKLTIKTPERRHNFEHISHLALVFLLLTLTM